MLIRDSSMLFKDNRYIYLACFDTLDEVTLIGIRLDLDDESIPFNVVKRVPYRVLNNELINVKSSETEYSTQITYFKELIQSVSFSQSEHSSPRPVTENSLSLLDEETSKKSLLSFNNKRKPFVLTKDVKELLDGRYLTSCFINERNDLVINIEKAEENTKAMMISHNFKLNKTLIVIYNNDFKLDNLENTFLSSKSEINLLKNY